jgi:hypothetical protein
VLRVMARGGGERLPKLGKDGQLIEMEMQMGKTFNRKECEDEVVAALCASRRNRPIPPPSMAAETQIGSRKRRSKRKSPNATKRQS